MTKNNIPLIHFADLLYAFATTLSYYFHSAKKHIFSIKPQMNYYSKINIILETLYNGNLHYQLS